MFIECPKCFKYNDLKLKENVKCGHCQEELSGHKYKKRVISVTTALMIGVGGSYATNKYLFTENRYPLAVEYSIIESCVNSHKKPLAYSVYGKKREICLCALEETIDDVSYKKFSKDETSFLITFEKKAKQCGKAGD
jgi:hypothetical protein